MGTKIGAESNIRKNITPISFKVYLHNHHNPKKNFLILITLAILADSKVQPLKFSSKSFSKPIAEAKAKTAKFGSTVIRLK